MNRPQLRHAVLLSPGLLLGLLSLTACGPVNSSTPALPVAMVIEAGSVYPISLPIRVQHDRFMYFYIDELGNSQLNTSEVELFPADVFVTYDPAAQSAHAFLRRSPHGGCLLNWNLEAQTFDDPCFGSRFTMDGKYQSGPSPRSLDELPAEVKDQMIWVRNEVVYGQSHP